MSHNFRIAVFPTHFLISTDQFVPVGIIEYEGTPSRCLDKCGCMGAVVDVFAGTCPAPARGGHHAGAGRRAHSVAGGPLHVVAGVVWEVGRGASSDPGAPETSLGVLGSENRFASSPPLVLDRQEPGARQT